MADVSLSFAGAELVPLPCGALFWPARSLLLAADLHLEKGSSLARWGWMLPPYDSVDTLQRLVAARDAVGAAWVILLGDSFHDADGPSRMPPNARALLDVLATSDLLWIGGNHDGLCARALPGRVAAEATVDGIRLVHEIDHSPGAQIGGHWHPKMRVPLRGGGVAVRRCVAVRGDRLILPAYGAYAGGVEIGDPALVAAIGGLPDGVLAVADGLVRVRANRLHRAA